MRLKDTFITHDSDGEQVLIDVTSTFAGLVRSNKTAAFIVECLKTDTTEEQIVDAMYEKYDAPKEVLQKDVEAIVEKLRGIGALVKTSYEEYIRKYHTLTYKNVGVSMLPLLKQGRDSFTVREVKQGESCKLWDVVLYKRGTDQYVLHRIIKVYDDSYDILGDNCIGIERGIKKTDVLGVMTDFTHKGKQYKTDDIGYRLYVWLWCRPYKLRIFLKKIRMRLQSVLRKKREK